MFVFKIFGRPEPARSASSESVRHFPPPPPQPPKISDEIYPTPAPVSATTSCSIYLSSLILKYYCTEMDEARSPSPLSASEQARIRRERRQAKVRGAGTDRLSKITGTQRMGSGGGTDILILTSYSY